LLHADHEPQTPREWEQWFMTIRRALTKQYIVQRVDGHGGEIVKSCGSPVSA